MKKNNVKLVFATHNENKLQEVQNMLPSAIKLLSLKDINCLEDIEETETTLQGNAHLKAHYVLQNYKYDCFADDTGLEVEVLNNRPGVYSARYAGEENNAEKNMQKLLLELKGKTNRKAQFRTVISLHINEKKYLFEGVCKGEILTGKRGEAGFGYDPVFMPNGYQKSFAEMTQDEKNEVSHRGKAIQKLVNFLSLFYKENEGVK